MVFVPGVVAFPDGIEASGVALTCALVFLRGAMFVRTGVASGPAGCSRCAWFSTPSLGPMSKEGNTTATPTNAPAMKRELGFMVTCACFVVRKNLDPVDYSCKIAGVPGDTEAARAVASQLVMRMQPWDCVFPTVRGSGVPWMP